MGPSIPDKSTEDVAFKLIAKIRRGTFSEDDFLQGIQQLNEEQKTDFYEVCAGIYSSAILELARIDDNDIGNPSSAADNARDTSIAETRAFAEAAERLYESVTIYTDHKLRGAIQFNKRFLNS